MSDRTYVDKEQGAHNQARKREAIAHDFHGWASRTKGGRGDIGSTIVVNHNADREVECSYH